VFTADLPPAIPMRTAEIEAVTMVRATVGWRRLAREQADWLSECVA
jgi:hypothetical protein